MEETRLLLFVVGTMTESHSPFEGLFSCRFGALPVSHPHPITQLLRQNTHAAPPAVFEALLLRQRLQWPEQAS